MPNEKDAVTSFLNEHSEENTESKDIFKEETTQESEEVVEEESEKALPFHKDPKIIRFIEKEVAKRAESFRPSAEQQFRDEVKDINLPSSFVKLVGNDTPEKVEVLKDLSKYFGTLKGEARQEFLQEMQEQQQQAVEADQKAQDELDTYFDEIEEIYSVDLSSNSASAKKMRTDFIDYVRKIAPKNEDGEVAGFPDLVASFEEFQERSKRTSQPSRAKELASRGLARSSDTSTEVPKGRSWKDVDRFFSSLNKN